MGYDLIKFVPLLFIILIIVKVHFQNSNNSKNMQLELFDYRRDYLFEFKNQIAWYFDVLKETHDSITYAEHIVPHKGKAICGMEYEEYIDVKKYRLGTLTYDQILVYLKEIEHHQRAKEHAIISQEVDLDERI